MICQFVIYGSEPTNQPTGLNFSDIQWHKFTVNWTPAASDGTVVLMKNGSPVTESPVDGTVYSQGDAIGGSEVIYSGAGSSVSLSGLTEDSTYYFSLFSFNGVGFGRKYRLTSPLTGSQAPTFTFGGSLDFDGVNDYVTMVSLNVGLIQSFEVWINCDNTAGWNGQIFNNPSLGSQFKITRASGASGGFLLVDNNSNVWSPGLGSYSFFTHHHVLASRDNGVLNIFVDGVLFKSQNIGISGGDITITHISDPSAGFAGKIGIARIYTSALNITDAVDLYNSGLGRGPKAGCIRSWEFREGSGVTVKDELALSDSSRNLTLAGGANAPSWSTWP